MAWGIEFVHPAFEELEKLDKQAQRSIVRFLRTRIATDEDPKRFGKPLLGDKKGLWRYRIGDFRIVVRLDAVKKAALVVRVGHRKNVYG